MEGEGGRDRSSHATRKEEEEEDSVPLASMVKPNKRPLEKRTHFFGK